MQSPQEPILKINAANTIRTLFDAKICIIAKRCKYACGEGVKNGETKRSKEHEKKESKKTARKRVVKQVRATEVVRSAADEYKT